MAGRLGWRVWDHGRSIKANVKSQSRLELKNLKRTSFVLRKGENTQEADASEKNSSSPHQQMNRPFVPSTGQHFGSLGPASSSSAPRAFHAGVVGAAGTEIHQASEQGLELCARVRPLPPPPRRCKLVNNFACSAARVGIIIKSSSPSPRPYDRRASTVAGCVRRRESSLSRLEALDVGIVAIAEGREEEQASENDHHETTERETGDREVHSPPSPTTTTTEEEGQSLGGALVLDLPKIDNPTMDVIQRVCGMRDDIEWGPETVKELENANMSFTPFLIQQIVQRMPVKSVDWTWSFFRWARERQGGSSKLTVHVAMLGALGRAKKFEIMKEALDLVIEDGHKKCPWPYNKALKWCSRDENVAAALYFWNKMKESNCKATVVTYTRLIDLLARHGHLDESLELFRQMLQANCPPNISTYNVLIQAFGTAGNLEVASSLFSKLSELGCKPNYSTYSKLISLHLEGGKPDEALEFIKMMRATGTGIGSDVYDAVNKAFPSLNKEVGEEVFQDEGASPGGWERPVSSPSQPDMRTRLAGPSRGRTMSPRVLIGLLERGEPLSVEENLDKIKPAIYPRFVVRVLQWMKNTEAAMGFFNWAKLQPHYQHNEFCYSMMINILGRSKNLELIDKVVKDMQEDGVKINTPIFSALIACYGRAKSMEGALNVFAQMKEWGCKPDVVTYTTLIHLLAKHGSHVSAIKMFEEMQGAGIAPNTQTYTVMIYSLVKAGKVSEAVSLLREMPQLGCQPNAITYATIIDRCAKDGQLETAKELVSRMEEQGITPLRTTITILGSTYRKAEMNDDADRLFEKFRHRRYWDETFKSSTERVAQELLLSKAS